MQGIYEELAALHAKSGVDATLDRLIAELRSEKRYHELFEALKMRVRRTLDLPMLYSDTGDQLSPQKRLQLEEGLIEACREVGTQLLSEGRLRDGWIYLRPVGDRAEAAKLLAKIPVDEDNLEEMIEVLLREGVDPARGFQLVLENYGTCNAITTFDSEIARHDKAVQRAAASLLVRKLHEDLIANVRADIARQQTGHPTESTLAGIVAERDWLFLDNSYHVDTTHLASTIRAARLLNNPDELRLALDLTAYGRCLAKQFQYPGDEPFLDQYTAGALWFQALLGENVDAALEYFRQKAESCDPKYTGSLPAEVYVELLTRLERYDDAIAASIKYLPADLPRMGVCPSLLELAELSGHYHKVLQHTRDQQDLLAFTAALVKAKKNAV
ncbi:MAG TPA: hypothetical protein VL096_11960 [Pirellulaceae bacterium]|nr:hypothetical protein [Pirellulaceae bacterium]